MQRRAVLRLCQLRRAYVVAIGFVDHYSAAQGRQAGGIGYRPLQRAHQRQHSGRQDNAALDALQLIAGTGNLDKQEEVHHRVHGGLALAHAYA